MSDTRAATRDAGSATAPAALLAGVVFVVSVAAFVLLELADKDTEGLMLLCGPAVGALIVSAQVGVSSKRQERRLENVESQTNGRLTSKDAEIAELSRRLTRAETEAAAATAREQAAAALAHSAPRPSQPPEPASVSAN